jgi:hypothetical protein
LVKTKEKLIELNYFLPTANMNCIAPLTSKQMKPNMMLISWQRTSGSNGGLKEIIYSISNISKFNKMNQFNLFKISNIYIE